MLDKDTRLAMAVAMDKALKPVLEDLKAENRAEMAQAWNENHVTQRAIMVGDTKVGTASYAPPKLKIVMRSGAEEEALGQLMVMGLTEEQPIKGWQEHFVIKDGAVVDPGTGEDMSDLFIAEPTLGVAYVRGCNYEDVSESIQRAGLDGASTIAGMLGI